jgi:hypothetical protein
MKQFSIFLLLIGVLVALQPVQSSKNDVQRPLSFAIYAEYARDSNKLMKNGLNRRIFNVVETESGSDISLESRGVIRLQPGTYRVSGYSIASMQDTFAAPIPLNNDAYPGYSLVYLKEFEKDPAILQHAIAIGTPQTAQFLAPSMFDFVYTTEKTARICVGHQSGNNLNQEVFLSIYDVDGTKSDFHVFARISITKL